MKEFKTHICEIVREVMDLDITKYAAETKIRDIAEWDSFNNLMLISRLQEDLKVEFTAREIDSTQTIDEFWRLLDRKRAIH